MIIELLLAANYQPSLAPELLFVVLYLWQEWVYFSVLILLLKVQCLYSAALVAELVGIAVAGNPAPNQLALTGANAG